MGSEQDIISKLDEIRSLLVDNARLKKEVHILEEVLANKNQFIIAFENDLKIIYHNLPNEDPLHSVEDLSILVGSINLEMIKKSLADKVSEDLHFHQGRLLFRMSRKHEGFNLLMIESSEEADMEHDRTVVEDLSAAGEEAEEIRRLTVELELIKKIHLEDNPSLYTSQIRDIHLPRLAVLKQKFTDPVLSMCLDIIEQNLMEILEPVPSSFSRSMLTSLTPSELRIAEFIKTGKSTKEIADALSIAAKTVENHRNNLRSKLGIANKRINLRTYLMNLLE